MGWREDISIWRLGNLAGRSSEGLRGSAGQREQPSSSGGAEWSEAGVEARGEWRLRQIYDRWRPSAGMVPRLRAAAPLSTNPRSTDLIDLFSPGAAYSSTKQIAKIPKGIYVIPVGFIKLNKLKFSKAPLRANDQ